MAALLFDSEFIYVFIIALVHRARGKSDVIPYGSENKFVWEVKPLWPKNLSHIANVYKKHQTS